MTGEDTAQARRVGRLLLALYLLTSGGRAFISDGELMLLTAVRLVDAHTLALPAWAAAFPQVARGIDGLLYSRYAPAQPLLAALLYWAARYGVGWHMLPGCDDFAFGKFVALLLPAFATAGSGALLCEWGAALYRSQRIGVALALLYGVGTLAWPYSRFFFSEPLFTAFLLLALVRLWHGQPLRAGFAAGWMLATRVDGVLLLPPLLLYGWLRGVRGARLAALLPGVAAGAALLLLHNWLRFGTLRDMGYAGEGFTGDLLVGLYGLLLSPGKSLLLYVPLLLALPWALRRWARRMPAEALLVALVALVWLLRSALWWCWWGGWGWGPRFLVVLMPLLVLPLGALLQAPRARAQALLWLLLPLSMAVNLLGILVDFNPYLAELTRGSSAREALSLYLPGYSPLLAHVRRFDMSAMPVVGFALDAPHVGLPAGMGAWCSAALVALVVVCARSLVYNARQ